MSRNTPRYFVEQSGRQGPRFFWKPGKDLRAEGWKMERIPEAELRAAAADESDLRAEAYKRAEQLNGEVDRWRKGLAPVVTGGAAARPSSGAIKPRTVAHLIREYKKSRFFTDRAPATRASYTFNMNLIEAWAGDIAAASIGPARVQKLYESLYAATPAKANHVVAVLRILLQHAVRLEWVRSNAAEKPGLTGQPFTGRLWPIDAVSLFVETADRMRLHSVGTAVVVNHWIGQRQGDVLALTRGAYRDGRFHIAQQKSRGRSVIAVPHSPWIAARIEAELGRQATRRGNVALLPEVEETAPLLLCETTGRQWGASHFRHVFAEIRAAAAGKWGTFFLPGGAELAMLDLDFMHLRHTAVTELALAGCTIPEIAAITGHTIKSVYSILQRYLVLSTGLADAAMAKRLTLDTEIAALLPSPAKTA